MDDKHYIFLRHNMNLADVALFRAIASWNSLLATARPTGTMPVLVSRRPAASRPKRVRAYATARHGPYRYA